MSEIMIALLLLVPIVTVVIIINTVHKSGKKRMQGKIQQYINEVMKETGAVSHDQRQLIHQAVIIDEKSRRLLVIDHKQQPFSYDIFHLDLIKNVQVLKEQGPERIVTHISVELTPGGKLITLYDYHTHNVFQMADFEKAANALKEQINKVRTNTSLVT